MKILFDENVSPKLPHLIASEYPGSEHATSVGLRGCDDHRIWEYSRAQRLGIASKDTDFRERSFVEGFPPKVIWLDVGNADTKVIADLLRCELPRVEAFEQQDEASFLIISLSAGAV